MVKSYARLIWLKICLFFIIGLFASEESAAQRRYKNDFRSSVGFGYIVDDDNSGAIFTNQYIRELSNTINGSITLEYLSSSRFEKGRRLFTSRKAFIMGDASLLVDVLDKGITNLKIGAGVAWRRRSELDLSTSINRRGVITPGNVPGEYFVHQRNSEYGGKLAFENDFYKDSRLTFGWRGAGYIYLKGTPIFTTGLHMGFAF